MKETGAAPQGPQGGRRGNMIEELIALLPRGEENALPASYLTAALDLSSTRDLRRLVRKARLDGNAICASVGGYFLPANSVELRSFITTTAIVASSIRELVIEARKQLLQMEQREMKGGRAHGEKH